MAHVTQHLPTAKGHLQIIVHKGRNLRDVQSIGKQDPFVKISIGRNHLKTGVHDDGGRNPVWEKELNLQLDGTEKDLTFEVINKNVVSDDTIGSFTLVSQEIPLNLGTKWHNITFGKNNQVCGELLITLVLNGKSEVATEAKSPATSPVAYPPQPAPAQAPSPVAPAMVSQVYGNQPVAYVQPQGQGFGPQQYPPQGYPPQGYPPQPMYVQQQAYPGPQMVYQPAPYGAPQQPMYVQQQPQPVYMAGPQPQPMYAPPPQAYGQPAYQPAQPQVVYAPAPQPVPQQQAPHGNAYPGLAKR